jgi:pimeloyl-ACP methyl ester carboxylesterase
MEVTVKGISVHTEVYGSGKPIVMIHGWSPDHRLMTGTFGEGSPAGQGYRLDQSRPAPLEEGGW